MGGLDSRMAIGKSYNGLGEPGRVISLTTLSTPHLGSPVADLLVGDESDANNFRGGVLDVIQKLGIDTRALRDLTAKAVKEIPNIVETNKSIKYFSYAAAGHANPPPTSAALAVPYQFIKLTRNEDNDGVVTVPSAKYGDFQGIWPCDHVEMVGYDLDTLLAPPVLGALKDFFSRTFGLGSPEFKHLAKFDEIVAALQRIDGNQPK
jgi:triacylglycerol lipase